MKNTGLMIDGLSSRMTDWIFLFRVSCRKAILFWFCAALLSLPGLAGAADGEGLGCRYLNTIESIYLNYHIKYSNFDSALRDRVVEQYVKKLDFFKVNLLASDVAKIKGDMAGIFDRLKARDCSSLDKAKQLVLERLKERAKFVKNMLGSSYKFDPSVEFVLDTQKKPFPATKKEAEEFLRKYVHFQISNYLAADQKLPEAKANVIKSWVRNVRRLAEQSSEKAYAEYLDAFALALDPHSSYFSKEQNEDFRIFMSLSLEGIGANLSSQDGFTVVESLVSGGAAARSGLIQTQDKVIAVGQGEKGPMENVIELDITEVVKKIRGPKGTKVRLMILRKKGAEKKRLEVTLVRDQVRLENDAANIHYLDKEIQGVKKKIAILELPSFYSDARRGGRSSASDLKKLIMAAKSAKADGVVLDLSKNGGGSLEDAVKIAGLFFSKGNVVKQSSRDDKNGEAQEMSLMDTDPTVDWPGPMTILTSRISASASEIVSGALRDYKRAVIVGSEHTFGKGSVQTVMDIPSPAGEWGAVKVTVGMFYTVGGFSTQHRGVEADVKIPGPFDQDDIGEKSLDYSLPPKQVPAFLSKEAYEKEGEGAWTPLRPEWVKVLAERSKNRVAQSADFKKIIEDLKKEADRGKLIKVSDAVKDREKRESKKTEKNAPKENREKEYLKRADVQEAANVLADLIALEAGVSLAGSAAQ